MNKRKPGRPAKPKHLKAVPLQTTVEPKVKAWIQERAEKDGLSQGQLIELYCYRDGML